MKSAFVFAFVLLANSAFAADAITRIQPTQVQLDPQPLPQADMQDAPAPRDSAATPATQEAEQPFQKDRVLLCTNLLMLTPTIEVLRSTMSVDLTSTGSPYAVMNAATSRQALSTAISHSFESTVLQLFTLLPLDAKGPYATKRDLAVTELERVTADLKINYVRGTGYTAYWTDVIRNILGTQRASADRLAGLIETNCGN